MYNFSCVCCSQYMTGYLLDRPCILSVHLSFDKCINQCNQTTVKIYNISVIPENCLMPFSGQFPLLPLPFPRFPTCPFFYFFFCSTFSPPLVSFAYSGTSFKRNHRISFWPLACLMLALLRYFQHLVQGLQCVFLSFHSLSSVPLSLAIATIYLLCPSCCGYHMCYLTHAIINPTVQHFLH